MHDRGVRGFGLGLSLGAASSAILSPAVLFGENLVVWHDNQDLSTMFSDFISTPAVVGSSVALQLDSAQGGALGSDIKSTGTPALIGTATAATYDTSTGAATVVRVDASNQSYITWTGLTSNRMYLFEISNTGASPISFRQGGPTATVWLSVSAGETSAMYVTPGAGTQISIICATGGAGSAAFTVHSVKECLGAPRYQSTSAQRPILGRHPKGGRRNLVLHTENLTSGWGGATTKTIAAETYNGSPFTTVTKTTASASEAAAQAVGVLTGGQPYTITCAFLAGTVTACQLGIHNPTDVWGASSVAVAVIEGPGAAGFSGSLFTLSGLSSTVPTVVRLTFTKATTASSTINLYPQSSGSTTIGHSVKVTRFQLETGSVATPYQKVTTQYDCTETGVPDVYFLQADGSDDGMVTPTLDLSATDKIGVFTAVRKLSDAARGIPVEFGTGTTNGFTINAPAAASATFRFSSAGSVQVDASTAASFAAPITSILTGLGDISGDSAILRVNGTQAASSTSDQGTGNYGNYALYYFRRGGTTLPFNGLDYGNFIVSTLPDAAQIAAGEAYQNNYIEAY